MDNFHQGKFRQRLSLLNQTLIKTPSTSLETESNGVSPNGVPIYSQDPPSCWSIATDEPIPGTHPIEHGGTCRVCVVQNATGEEPNNIPSYEMWVRDDKNYAIGNIDPFTMAPWPGPFDTTSHQPVGQSFPVGAASLNVWSSLPDSKYVVVYMVWDKPAGWDGPETMRFDTGSEQKIAANNCTLSTAPRMNGFFYFSCQFNCGTIDPRL